MNFSFLAVESSNVNCSCGIHDRQWQAGKPRAGTDIEDALATQVRLHGQAVEQVLGDLRAPLTNRGEVHALVPLVQLVEQAQQLPGLRRPSSMPS